MPGRLFLTPPLAEVAAAFGAEPTGMTESGAGPDLAPGDTAAVVVFRAGARRLAAMRWGMIPMGRTNARGRPVLESIVNARAETLFSKSAYRGVGRCLLPVSGWYESTGTARRKTRWAIAAPERPLLAFAAVWDAWQAPGGAEVRSFATVTCAPNADVAPVHDRMPVILAPGDWPVWLGESAGDPAALLRPLQPGVLRVAEATTRSGGEPVRGG